MATFGFSVGDFLAALKLVGTIIDGLHASGHSRTRFRNLLSELYTLEDALIRVKRLDIVDDDEDGSQAAERIALQQAAALCQRSMYEFYKKIEKYQPHLTMCAAGGKNWLKDGWMKIKWAMCRAEDVELFQAELRGHRGSIEILLLTLQLNRSSIQAKAQEQRQRSLAGKIQDLSSEWMGKLANLSSNVASCMEQGKQMVESTVQILRTNIQLFQHIREIQHFITRIPGQVERQQPVYLIDALGKASPFHLEFVRSVEAFTAILKVNFKDTGIGPRMIERGEFVIQKSGSQLEIDLTKPWEMCFSPGQRVAMTREIIRPQQGKNGSSLRLPINPQSLEKRKRKDGLEDDILNFRRVQIEVDMSRTRCKLYELRDNDWVDRGTGSCHYRYINGLPWLEVEPEGLHESTAEVLCIGKIDGAHGYQRQQEALIVWTERNGTDMALSFQDSEGCKIIWEVINTARARARAELPQWYLEGQ